MVSDVATGRPPRVPGVKPVRVDIEMTPEELATIRRAAQQRGQTVSAYMRDVAWGAADDDLAFDRRDDDRRRVQVDIARDRRIGVARRRG
jgi:uncharacterized protein (DUF1778 family)